MVNPKEALETVPVSSGCLSKQACNECRVGVQEQGGPPCRNRRSQDQDPFVPICFNVHLSIFV
jgi:Na+-transporting NADH:ubiquinone oxidoreductase subunit NqrF